MAQKLLLFESIVNRAAIKSNRALMAELEKLAEHVFGESDFTIEDDEEDGEGLQGWCNDELQKSIVNDYCSAFRFKSAFEIQDEDYAGPVMAWFFEPDGAFDDQVIVFTCESEGVFKNPRYVCGLLIDEYDLDRLLDDLGDDEDEDDDEEEEEDDDDDKDWDDDDDEEDDDDDDDDGFRVVDGKCVFPDKARKIPDEAFIEEPIESVEIPESVEVIGDSAFFMCTYLKTVKINGPLKKILEDAFGGCKRLISINIPNTVTLIDDSAFSGCRKLEQLVIPDSVIKIGEYAFDECDSLERVYIKNPKLLKDTGINDNVEIITDFDEKDIQTVIQRSAREHIFLYPIKATVGQAIKDLKKIVHDNPNGFVSFSDPFHNGGDNYITDVLEWNGLVVLTSSSDEDDAACAEDLLDKLSDIDGDTKLLLGGGWGWELRNLDPEEDGTLFLSDEDDIYLHYEEHDIRLFSAEDLSHLFSDFAEKYPDRKVFCKTKDGSYYPVINVYDDDGVGYVIVKKSDETVSASDFKDALDDFEWNEGNVVVSFSPTKSYAAIFAKHDPVFFEDKVDGEDVIAFRLGETLCDTRIEDPYDNDVNFFNDDDTVVTVDDLCDEEEDAEKETMESNDTVEEETATEMESTPAPESKSEVVAKAEKTEQGDIILKLVSYSGSIIKMMTVLSSIDGIDEEEAFHILQKLPSVVREGITAKTAMKIGAILEEAGAVVDLKRASDSVAEAELPKSAPVEPESEPEPQPEPEQPKRPPMEYVDLGLSVKWAKWNLGASAPEEIGDYFAWGECEKKDFYYWDNYKFRGKDGLLKYNYKESYGSTVDKIKELELSDDAAHQILGEDWRMPTIKEFEELKENCTLSYTSINGVKGLKYRSKKKGYTDRWIFLPYTGFKSIKEWYFEDKCFYWTSTLYTRRPDSSMIGIMVPVYEDKMDRYEGLCIRPVTK